VLPEVLSEIEDESMDDEGVSVHSDGDPSNDGSGESDSDSDSESASEETQDDQEQGDVDPEFRQKVAEALGSVGLKEDDTESDDSSEVLMDDDQMMQLDDKLANIFRAQSTVNKGKIGRQKSH
jgi:DNA polymerase phi